jgi:hypothetical protein
MFPARFDQIWGVAVFIVFIGKTQPHIDIAANARYYCAGLVFFGIRSVVAILEFFMYRRREFAV